METTEFDRRDFAKLLMAGAALLAGGTRVSLPASAQTGTRQLIDVHCHVFNGKDIPARQFVRTVVFENYPEEIDLGPRLAVTDVANRARDGAADLVVAMIEAMAPSIAAERDCIERDRCSWLGALIGGRSTEARLAGVGPILEEEMLADYARLKAGTPREKFFKGDEWKDRIENLDAVVELTDEPGQGEARSLDEGIPGLEEQAQQTSAARRLAAPSFSFGPTLAWGRLLSSYRRDIIGRYLETYNTGASRTVLFAPALVDFTGWLPGEQPQGLKEQVDLMHLLTRAQKSTLMHGYCAFDPLRQVRAVASGEPTPLDLAKIAVESRGFLGAKLYSPMGFRPFGNDELRAWPPVGGVGQDFGRKLDAALMSLYDWASVEGVPIMAHTMNSQAANNAYGERAHPSLWRKPLQRHPNLRLNLAHFGHFKPTEGSDIMTTWEWSIGDLIKGADYPNVFADLSYFSVLLGADAQNDAVKNHVRDALVRWIAEFDPQCRRLLYGTDWSMIARENNSDGYPKRMEDFLKSAGLAEPQLESIFFKNAVRYFGLGPAQPARQRLEKYYQDNGLAVAQLQKFD